LPEVLVVVAVIALIGALSFPAFRSAKAQSQVAASMNKLKQWHQANLLYCQEAGCEPRLVLEVPCSLTGPGVLYKFPREMYRTGGSSLTGRPGEDVYTYVPNGACHSEPALKDWLKRVADSGGNPAYVLDETQNQGAGSAREFFRTRRVLGLKYDGSVQTRWARGVLSRNELFDSDKFVSNPEN
jgi:type II secretory pathway pseudopilin PulG